MPFAINYDITFPPDTQLANLLGQDIRNLTQEVQQRMAAISGLDGSKPTFGSDAQPNNWNGVLFFATDTGKIYQWINPSWVNVSSNFFGSAPTRKFSQQAIATNGPGQNMNNLSVPSATMTSFSQIDFIYSNITTSGSAFIGLAINGIPIGANFSANVVKGTVYMNLVTSYSIMFWYDNGGSMADQTAVNLSCPSVLTNPFQFQFLNRAGQTTSNVGGLNLIVTL